MRTLAKSGLLALAVGFVLAQFFVLFFNHWYYAGHLWLKTGLLAAPLAIAMYILLLTSWRGLWLALGIYWLAVFAATALHARSLDLARLDFTGVLDYEIGLLWVGAAWIWIYAMLTLRRGGLQGRGERRATARQLAMRRRVREIGANAPGHSNGGPPPETETEAPPVAEDSSTAQSLLPIALVLLALSSPGIASSADESPDEPEPARPYADRHLEMSDQSLRLTEPQLPGTYPTPLHLRARQSFFIRIENSKDGAITVYEDGKAYEAGHVLAPVSQVNPNGFTASGWGAPGTVTATAVNAIHIKTAHDYGTGKGTIFSLTPVEFVDFDAKSYKSYFNQSSSLFTDIKAGTQIFGGKWAPLVSSRVYVRPVGTQLAASVASKPKMADAASSVPTQESPPGLAWGPELDARDIRNHPVEPPLAAPDGSGTVQPMPPAYVPAEGDVLWIEVSRLKYNPEWLEFENRFGGLIWVKEIGLDPYPIGQVLKPVAGVGRFLGTQYADTGRIRANHPGVIDISTCPLGQTGGFQIIPRDHSMSPEMTNARVKTQWMVIGPLWALDPSWEGLPPLFTDYLYPAMVDPFNADGSVNEEVQGADAFLARFTVRARYSDDPDPTKYVLLHPYAGLQNFALKTMTHVRIYFPRDSR